MLPSFTISLAFALFVQTGLIARLLARVLMYRPRGPSVLDTPQAAEARVQARREAAIADASQEQEAKQTIIATT
jgi:hypothetical protein